MGLRCDPRRGGGAKALAEQFLAKHGDAVPVRTLGESRDANDAGKKGVLVRDGLVELLEKEIGSARDAAKRRFDVVESFGWHDLTEAERATIEAARAALCSVNGHPAVTKLALEVVAFRSDQIGGSCDLGTGAIRVARTRLRDFYDLITTIVHEVAHAETQAQDGTEAFAARERAIWCQLYRNARENPDA